MAIRYIHNCCRRRYPSVLPSAAFRTTLRTGIPGHRRHCSPCPQRSCHEVTLAAAQDHHILLARSCIHFHNFNSRGSGCNHEAGQQDPGALVPCGYACDHGHIVGFDGGSQTVVDGYVGDGADCLFGNSRGHEDSFSIEGSQWTLTAIVCEREGRGKADNLNLQDSTFSFILE